MNHDISTQFPTDDLDSFAPRSAISYIRVSTARQADRGGARDGFSIPAQRDANQRQAHGLGALVAAEFVDRGQSGGNTDRPELQRMLAYLKDHQVDYVIVHKLDRLARSRADDIEITQAVHEAGARLVSSTESIDSSPNGGLMHGIMASIAELYSHNLAHEVMKGMRQKAIQGGTPGRAPTGYLNVRAQTDTDASLGPCVSTPSAPRTSPGPSRPTRRATGASLNLLRHWLREDFRLGRQPLAPLPSRACRAFTVF